MVGGLNTSRRKLERETLTKFCGDFRDCVTDRHLHSWHLTLRLSFAETQRSFEEPLDRETLPEYF